MSGNIWNNLIVVTLLCLVREAFGFTTSVWTYDHRQPQQSFEWRQSEQRHSPNNALPLFSSSGSSSANGSGGGSKNLSAARRERRDEEKRRSQRQDDVVIGKTSAMRDASDYQLNPKATEEEWMRQASNVDKKVFQLTEEGMESLKMLQLEEATAAFDEVFLLKPNAYLWQAGIAKFYLGDFEAAANIFARNAAVYESKFGGQASEERIWRHACELKMAILLDKKGRKITKANLDEIRANLEPIPEIEVDPDSLFAETRKVIRITGDLFESSVNADPSGVILARAKLRSIGGNFGDLSRFDRKMWKITSWFYLGLHYDAVGEVQESKECMKMAFRNCANAGKADNIFHALPLIHMSQRDWFDDDELDVDPLEVLRPSTEVLEDEADDTVYNSGRNAVDADPLVSDSIRKSIAKMKATELHNALKVRGIKCHGSKKELQNRLFRSLMNDAGLAP